MIMWMGMEGGGGDSLPERWDRFADTVHYYLHKSQIYI